MTCEFLSYSLPSWCLFCMRVSVVFIAFLVFSGMRVSYCLPDVFRHASFSRIHFLPGVFPACEFLSCSFLSFRHASFSRIHCLPGVFPTCEFLSYSLPSWCFPACEFLSYSDVFPVTYTCYWISIASLHLCISPCEFVSPLPHENFSYCLPFKRSLYSTSNASGLSWSTTNR